jgi:hypothetical protein
MFSIPTDKFACQLFMYGINTSEIIFFKR